MPALPGMSVMELAAADVWATGVFPDSYPTQFLRKDLDAIGVIPAERLASVPDGSRVLIAGAVSTWQRPATARGVTFVNIEDETGMVNVLCSRGCGSGTGGGPGGVGSADPRPGAERHRRGDRDRRADGTDQDEGEVPLARLPLARRRSAVLF